MMDAGHGNSAVKKTMKDTGSVRVCAPVDSCIGSVRGIGPGGWEKFVRGLCGCGAWDLKDQCKGILRTAPSSLRHCTHKNTSG